MTWEQIYDVGANLLSFIAYGSWFVEVCLVKCYYDMLVLKMHAKWVAYLYMNMDAVDVHKRKLVLKMGYSKMNVFLCLL